MALKPIQQPPEAFSKARALATRLGVSVKTIKRWANEGKLRSFKVSSRLVLYSEADVIALIKNAEVTNSVTEGRA